MASNNPDGPEPAPPDEQQQPTLTAKAFVIPDDIKDHLGPSPLTAFEDAASYQALFEKFALTVDPADFIEWLYVKDATDLTWEINRYKRAKIHAINQSSAPHARKILLDHYNIENMFTAPILASMDAEKVADGNKKKINALKSALKKQGEPQNVFFDAVYASAIDQVERYDRLIDKALTRRESAFREIDRRRDAIARRLRAAAQAADNITDAEFE